MQDTGGRAGPGGLVHGWAGGLERCSPPGGQLAGLSAVGVQSCTPGPRNSTWDVNSQRNPCTSLKGDTDRTFVLGLLAWTGSPSAGPGGQGRKVWNTGHCRSLKTTQCAQASQQAHKPQELGGPCCLCALTLSPECEGRSHRHPSDRPGRGVQRKGRGEAMDRGRAQEWADGHRATTPRE